MSEFSAVISLSSLDGTTGFKINGEAASDLAGWSVSSAGDINGDGFDDVIVGALGVDQNGDYSGASYLVFGKAAGFASTLELADLDGTNGFKINGAAAVDMSGRSVSSAGDVNGDGFDDLIVGAPYASPNGSYSGASYVVFGKASGFASTLELSDLDGTAGFKINGEVAHDVSGWSVSSAGDINGDGFDDLIIGAYGADPTGIDAGSSYVVFGKAGGFSSTLELSSLDGTNGFQIDGEAAYDFSGRSVSSAGDVNGDGFADLIIGAPYADANGMNSGASYVVFGKADGFASTLELSGLDGTNGFRINSEAKDDRNGFSVSSAGDVNGDGFADLIIGAYRADPNGDASGASYVVFGKAGGFSSTLDLSGLDGTNGFQINGEAAENMSGFSVSSAGDVNGDGFADLVIGAKQADSNGNDSGASYVVFGKAGGFSSTLELSDLDGTNGFRIDGALAYDQSGYSVSSAGDVNGDGFDDLVVGTPHTDPNGSASGASYIIFGRAPDAAVTRTGTAIGQTIHGGAFGDTLDGAGGSDTLVGGAGDDIYVTDGGDTITEKADAGTDTVKSSVTYVLGSNLEKLVLTGTADRDATGNLAANTLTGNASANTLSGLGGNDTLDGGAGNDRLDGGTGTDTMAGGKGNDIYVVDVKGDVVSEAKSAGTDTVWTALNSYTLGSNVENLTLSGKTDLKGTGNTAANMLTGNSGDNKLYGLSGNDTLNGGSGNDVITGGTGIDKLTGGASADTFVFALGDTVASKSKADTILDMTKADHIDLHLIDANEDKSGNQKFDFIGTDKFSGHAGELRYEKTSSDTWIYADTDGDRKIDFTIHLDDAMVLKDDYFVL